MTPERIEAYLQEPHIANLATVRPDGSPHVAPVWFDYDGKVVKVIAEKSAVKVKNIQYEPRASISIATDASPYEYVIVNGTAALSYEGIPDLVLSMAVHYQGKEEGEAYTESILKQMDFCVITVTPSKIIGWSSEDE